MKYFIHLSYNGSNYRGWQRQPNAPSVQQALEEGLSELLGTKTVCSSCGRTDAQVHALQFFAHIKTEKELLEKDVFILNKLLPDDIVVYEFIPVDKSAHAQNDALSRTYLYHIHTVPNPMIFDLSSYYDLGHFDVDAVKEACRLLVENDDFRSMCKQPDQYKTTLCKLSVAEVSFNKSKASFLFRFTSDRFLRGMVRLMVGRLLQIAKGELTVKEFSDILSSRLPIPSKIAVYPQGLYLGKVSYSYIDIEPKSSLEY